MRGRRGEILVRPLARAEQHDGSRIPHTEMMSAGTARRLAHAPIRDETEPAPKDETIRP